MKNIISSSSDLFSSPASFSLSSIISCASDFSILKFSLIKSTNLRRKHFFSSSILKVTHVTISNTPFGNGDSSHLPYTLYLCLYFSTYLQKKVNKGICPTMSGVRYSVDFLVKAMEKGSNLKATGQFLF